MTAEDLINYVLSPIVSITEKYKAINVCNLGPGKLCNNPQSWRLPGTGCCLSCQYHTIDNGCTIVNLCCISYFCKEVKDKIDPLDWLKLKSPLIVLYNLGLEPRMDW